MIQHYYLGMPIWANKHWQGTLFKKKAKAADFLTQYAQVFNTVEGNNTFYGLPKPSTVEKWRHNTPAHFRFSFKFPKTISHVQKLRNVQAALREFYRVIAPLEEKIGILFLQLPPSFDMRYYEALANFLPNLSTNYTYAVEVRHHDFFDNSEQEQRFNTLLQQHRVNRAMFDTALLHSLPSNSLAIMEAQRKKPKMPARFLCTGQHPFLRFVGDTAIETNLKRLKGLAKITAQWINAGKTPFVFIHSPGGEVYAPHMAKHFHNFVQAHTNKKLGIMPTWPGQKERDAPQQLSLF